MEHKTNTSIIIAFISIINSIITNAQTDVHNILKSSEILLNGLLFLKNNKYENNQSSKFVESICVKNKLNQKIHFYILHKKDDGEEFKKELIIQMDSK